MAGWQSSTLADHGAKTEILFHNLSRLHLASQFDLSKGGRSVVDKPDKPIDMVEVDGTYIVERRKRPRGKAAKASGAVVVLDRTCSPPPDVVNQSLDKPNRRRNSTNSTGFRRRKVDRYSPNLQGSVGGQLDKDA